MLTMVLIVEEEEKEVKDEVVIEVMVAKNIKWQT